MVVGVRGNLFVVVVEVSDLFVVAVNNGLPSQLTGQRAWLLLLLCHLFKLTGLAAKNRTQTPKQTRTRVERKEYNVRRQRMSCCGCVLCCLPSHALSEQTVELIVVGKKVAQTLILFHVLEAGRIGQRRNCKFLGTHKIQSD